MDNNNKNNNKRNFCMNSLNRNDFILIHCCICFHLMNQAYGSLKNAPNDEPKDPRNVATQNAIQMH